MIFCRRRLASVLWAWGFLKRLLLTCVCNTHIHRADIVVCMRLHRGILLTYKECNAATNTIAAAALFVPLFRFEKSRPPDITSSPSLNCLFLRPWVRSSLKTKGAGDESLNHEQILFNYLFSVCFKYLQKLSFSWWYVSNVACTSKNLISTLINQKFWFY